MLKKKYLIIPLLIFMAVFVSPQFIWSPVAFDVPFAVAEPESQLWNTTWGGASTDVSYGVTVASDGVYVTGRTSSFGGGNPNAFLFKYDFNGDKLWNTTWGGSSNDYGYGVANASDGVYVTGKTSSFGGGNPDAFLVKYDFNGNKLWNTTWGGTGWDYGYGVTVVSDGVYVTGRTSSFGAGEDDAFLVKYDSDGSQLWNTTWGEQAGTMAMA